MSLTYATSWAGFGICFPRSVLKQALSVDRDIQAISSLKHMVLSRDPTLSCYGTSELIFISNSAQNTSLYLPHLKPNGVNPPCHCQLVRQDLGFYPLVLQRLCRLLKLENDVIGHWSLFMMQPGFLCFETIFKGNPDPLWPSVSVAMAALTELDTEYEEEDLNEQERVRQNKKTKTMMPPSTEEEDMNEEERLCVKKKLCVVGIRQ